MDTRNKIFTVIGAVAVIATAGIGGYALFATPDKVTSTRISPSREATRSTMTVKPQTSPATNAPLKDGTYEASASYQIPRGGPNSVQAKVTISGGKITAILAKGMYDDRDSSAYVDSFNSEVASDATGKDLASYSPSRIGGASLTTAAFNNVLDTIRSKAGA